MRGIKLYSGNGARSRKRSAGKRRRYKNSPKTVFSVLFLVFLTLFVISAVIIIKSHIQGKQEQAAFAGLAATAEMSQEQTEETPKESQYTAYAALYVKNSDFVGWLHIDNTNIDYPVMSTPETSEYYLRRAFDKTSSQSGTPFVGAGGTIDSDMFIVYGHNMKNGTMFGSLDHYTAKEFWEESPSLLFTTTTEYREYEIFAALQTRVLYQNEAGYRWYYQAGDLTEEAFDELVSYLTENALYDTGITPTYGEQIIILSTCSYHDDSGRFLIAARMKETDAE